MFALTVVLLKMLGLKKMRSHHYAVLQFRFRLIIRSSKMLTSIFEATPGSVSKLL